MDYMGEALKKHHEWQGKFEIASRVSVNDKESLSLAYTPGVAAPCLEIQKDSMASYKLTRRRNLVAVITDGTAVLGLGDIGPLAGMPVMEGKCVLFKEFADVDAFPICVASKNADEIVRTIELISGSFGGINLEDISAPRCFEIERRLKEVLDIPVFHDDQHGTAVVATAALINASKVVGKELSSLKVVISGAGAAGIAIAKLFIKIGVGDIILNDRKGAIYINGEGQSDDQNEIAQVTNINNVKGTLADSMKGADVLVGVSGPNIVTKEMVRSMADKPIVFAMANPVPEIMPNDAREAGAFIIGTGRSDYPNQINNVLAFPGIFKGTLSVLATDINDEMKLAAAYAIAGGVPENELCRENILPNPFDKKVPVKISEAVAKAAISSGVARVCE